MLWKDPQQTSGPADIILGLPSWGWFQRGGGTKVSRWSLAMATGFWEALKSPYASEVILRDLEVSTSLKQTLMGNYTARVFPRGSMSIPSKPASLGSNSWSHDHPQVWRRVWALGFGPVASRSCHWPYCRGSLSAVTLLPWGFWAASWICRIQWRISLRWRKGTLVF